jgi:hypothetical protein
MSVADSIYASAVAVDSGLIDIGQAFGMNIAKDE